MRGCSVALAFVMVSALPAAAAAESWRGRIHCVVLPTLNSKPLDGSFELETDGTRVSFSRGVHNADTSSLSGIVETGTGSISGTDIRLTGGAAAQSYSYTSAYQGRIEGRHMTLSGEQIWQARTLPEPFHRACSITLSR